MHLEPETVLADDSGGHNRQRILHELEQQPGLCFRALARATGLASGTLRYHVGVLERWGLATTRRCDGQVLHFPGTIASRAHVLAARLRSLGPAWEAVYRHVREHPGQCQRAIIDALPNQAPSSVQHRLRRLVELGLLEARRRGLREVAYTPRPS